MIESDEETFNVRTGVLSLLDILFGSPYSLSLQVQDAFLGSLTFVVIIDVIFIHCM